MSMPTRRVRRGRGGGASGPISSSVASSTSPSGQRSRISRMGVVVEDDGGDDDEGDSWVWGEDAAATTAAAGHSTTRRELGGEGGHGNEMSLSEKLRQHELLEQQQQKQQLQQQQQPQYLHSRRERGGAMLDADHSSGRKIPLSNNQSTKYSSSSADSVDSGGWSWPSMSSTTSPTPTNNKTNNSTTNAKVASSSGNNKRNQRGRQYLYNKYSKRGKFTNTVYQSQIKTRIMSAMNCTKSPQHDDDNYDNSDEEEDKEKHQQQTQNIIGMAKLGLMLLIMVGGASRLGRRRHIPRSASSYKSMSSSSISMNDAHLRGQRPFYDAGSGRTREGNNYTLALGNLSQSTILLPVQISSHLSDITLPYNSNNNNSTDMNNASKATPYFWDVHFSGESVAEYIFSACHGLIQACELGIRQPDFNEDELEVFKLDGAQYVNVDTTTKDGIHRAYELKLAQSHLADVVISPMFHYMASHIFSSDNPGLMFALFRHPVDRAVSMYYYLAKATWDPHYNPDLAKMTLEQYAKSRYIENNWLTRFLVNKLGGKLSRADVQLAKEIIKAKCLVGLYDDMEVSMARFQRYFGWNAEETDENKTSIAHCRSAAVRKGDKHVVGHPSSVVKDVMNSDTNMTSSSPIMPVVRPGSIAWKAIVRMNMYDMELYEFVEKIYHIQGEEIFGVVGYEVLPAVAVRGENLADTAGFERPLLPDDPFESSIATDDNPGKTMPF